MPDPPRLYCILAREAPTGVIFRRGPSKWVQLIRWNTYFDTFECGQWLHGRIYEKRGDLSPDGSKLIYSVLHQHRAVPCRDGETPAWTAISRPPYLTALALWPQTAMDLGGGLFLDERTLCLGLSPDHAPPAAGLAPPKDITVELCATGDWTQESPHCRQTGGLLCRRLARDGWRLRQKWQGIQGRSVGVTSTSVPEAWEKVHSGTGACLVMLWSQTRSHDGYQFFVEQADSQVRIEGAEWADWDHNGRLVYAAYGKLFALDLSGKTLMCAVELADFNASKPESVEPPDWVTRWVEPSHPNPRP